MRRQIIIDTETTGLDPERHEIWELACIERDPDGTHPGHLWRMEPDLSKADPAALRVGRYYERTRLMRYTDQRLHDLAGKNPARPGYWTEPKTLAPEVARYLDDVTLIAANPAFDAGFLAAFLRSQGHAATWHYRLRDIGSMAWAWLRHQCAADFPAMDASTDLMATALGVDPAAFDRHSALGDCLLVAAMLDVIEGRP